LVLGLVSLLVAAALFIRHRMAYAVTDAVFVRSDSLTNVGFNRVSGRVVNVYKKEGDTVVEGEPLAEIDDTVYRLKVEKLTAELAAARKNKEREEVVLSRLRKETVLDERIALGRIDELKKKLAAVKARAAAVQADIDLLTRDRKRFHVLAEAGAVAPHRAEDIDSRLKARREEKRALEEEASSLMASIEVAKEEAEMARLRRLRVSEKEKKVQQLDETVKGLTAKLATARKDLSECVLKSPMDGRVAKRYLSAGSIASPQRAVYSLVNPRDLYVIALLEENKLKGVRRGNPVRISIDAYPHTHFEGVVEDVLPASAATFALAPRDISAGEFTKVAQRIPVRIRITEGDTSLLRVGMGGEVEIKRR